MHLFKRSLFKPAVLIIARQLITDSCNYANSDV